MIVALARKLLVALWKLVTTGEVADRHGQGRVVSTLEGGYALSALGRSVAVHIEAFLGGHPA